MLGLAFSIFLFLLRNYLWIVSVAASAFFFYVFKVSLWF